MFSPISCSSSGSKVCQVCMAGQKCASSLSVEQPSLGVCSQCHGTHQVIWREHQGPICCTEQQEQQGQHQCSPQLVDWLSESVHIGIDHHPIKESEVFSCLLNGLCRTLWCLLQCTWYMPGTSFRALNGLPLVFMLPFFLWHGNGGGKTAQFNLKTIQMDAKKLLVQIPM